MQATVRSVEPELLVPSPFRRRISEGDIDGLAESIRRYGVIHSPVARQVNGHLELVVGHRRRLASIAAGLTPIDVIVRELSDQEAAEIVVEENLAREDLHPMDEAELYEQLCEQHGYTLEQLADRFGREVAHIRRRLKLCALAASVRKRYLAGELSDRQAFKCARLPVLKDQERLATAIARSNKHDDYEFVGYEAERLREIEHDLKDAPFPIADAKLLPKVGACSGCLKRTGAQRELFSDVADKDDLCLDKACYQRKSDAFWKRATAAAKKTGTKILSKAEASAHLGHLGTPYYGSEYVKVTDSVRDVLGYQSKNKKTLKTALKSDPPPKVLARAGNGKVVELYPVKQVKAKLRKAGLGTKAGTTAASPPKTSAYQNRLKRERKVNDRAVELAIEKAVARAADPLSIDHDEILLALALLLSFGSAAQAVVKRRELDKLEADPVAPKGKRKRKRKIDESELIAQVARKLLDSDTAALAGLVVELALRDVAGWHGFSREGEAALQVFGVDLTACRKQARILVAAAEKKKKANSKASKKVNKKASSVNKKASVVNKKPATRRKGGGKKTAK